MALAETHSVNSNNDDFTGIRGFKANSLIIFLSGMVILISAFFVFLMIVKSVYGNYNLSEIVPTKENIFVQPEVEKAALLYSIYTENMSDDGNTWVQDNLNTWMNFLKKFNVPYDILTDVDIETGKHFDYKLLVLAGAKSLSDKEISQIKRYIDDGGSLFATGGVGTYSDEGKWKGWQFFTELLGMKFTHEISPQVESSKIHTLRGNLPITAGIPTGYTLNIATWDRPIYTEIIEPRTEQVSYWFDHRKEKGLVTEKIKKSTGITIGNYGNGRFIWFGFEINSVVGNQRDHIYFGRLFQNCINWLYYKPTALIKDWPAPYNAAAVFTPTFEKNYNNVNSLQGLLNQYKYPTTILVDAELAIRDSVRTKSLSRFANIIPIIDTSTTSFAETHRSIKDILIEIIGKDIYGVNCKHIKDEQHVIRILQENFSYILTDSLTDRSVPKKVVIDDEASFIIAQTARNDKQVIEEFGLTDLEFQKYTYEEDVNRILHEGGLYVMKFHNEYQFHPNYISVVNDLISYIRSKNIWFTSVDNIIDWWQKHSGIELRYDTRSDRRISVEVSNHERETIEEFIVQIFLNKNINNIEISAEMIHTPLPKYEFDIANNVLYLFVDKLEADETRTFLIDFENVELLSHVNNWN